MSNGYVVAERINDLFAKYEIRGRCLYWPKRLNMSDLDEFIGESYYSIVATSTEKSVFSRTSYNENIYTTGHFSSSVLRPYRVAPTIIKDKFTGTPEQFMTTLFKSYYYALSANEYIRFWGIED